MYSKQSHNARRGFTLTEAAIVLGIMGLILGAIWVAAAAVYQNIRVSRSSENLLQLTQAIRSLYASSSSVENLNEAGYIAAGIFPADLIEDKALGKSKNVWGGDVNVAQELSGAGFSITFTDVPANACVDFVMRNTGQGKETGLEVLTVNATAVSLPTSVTALNTACPDSGKLPVKFTFKLQN